MITVLYERDGQVRLFPMEEAWPQFERLDEERLMNVLLKSGPMLEDAPLDTEPLPVRSYQRVGYLAGRRRTVVYREVGG